MKFFDKLADTSVTRNHLPHWQQAGATYFVTWCLKDSIPRKLSQDLNERKEAWISMHPTPWSEDDEAEYHRQFSAERDRMLDASYGECILRSPECQKVLLAAMQKFDGKWFTLHSLVAMPNHVHVLFTLKNGICLGDVVAAWKRYSAMGINRLADREGALWQKDYFGRIIRDWDHLFRVARYIRRNPLKANINPEYYTLWEADWVMKMLG